MNKINGNGRIGKRKEKSLGTYMDGEKEEVSLAQKSKEIFLKRNCQ